jgi:hypothetical protein
MKRITSLLTGLAVATFLVTAPASAQSQRGLVNVFITDIEIIDDVPVTVVLEDINVGVGAALNVAANVCGVAVGVLASQLGQTGAAQCEVGDQTITLTRLIND